MPPSSSPDFPPFQSYPIPKEHPQTTYAPQRGSNPVLRGIALAIAGWVAASFNLVSSYLWSNAGFASLRQHHDLLDNIEPRYDPTVIPADEQETLSFAHLLSSLNRLAESSSQGQRSQNPYSSAVQYHELYRKGTLTPTAVAQTLLKLVSKPLEHNVAFLAIQPSQVLKAAELSTKRYQAGNPLSILDGVPLGIKDEVDLAGYSKSLGTNLDFTRPENDTSWCVRKWEAGGVIIGKLNMHELGLDTTNNNPTHGTPTNPHNSYYYPGGSSGGSGYVVSAGLVPVALGADGGGSIRIPSAFCGIYGLKPSHGRVSGLPTSNLASTCGVLGPIACSMTDLEIAYRIMATPDPDHPSSSRFPSPVPSLKPNAIPKVLGIYRPWFDSADGHVSEICHSAIAAYQSAGYALIDVSLPHLPLGQLAHAMTILTEISSDIHSLNSLTPATKILLSVGKETPASDFLLAQKVRHLLMQHLAFLFRQHPGLLIITPTTPQAGWHISGGAGDLKYGISDANTSLRNMEYVWMANFSGCPALSIPVGMVEPKQGKGNIPIGLMAMGEWGAEETLLEWGRIGEDWAWQEKEEKLTKPGTWVDVIEVSRRG